jgi:hypothetical protein
MPRSARLMSSSTIACTLTIIMLWDRVGCKVERFVVAVRIGVRIRHRTIAMRDRLSLRAPPPPLR